MNKTTPLILIILILLYSYFYVVKMNRLFIIFFMLLAVLILIQLLNIKRYYKNILTIIIVLLYYRNIMMCYDMFKVYVLVYFKYPIYNRIDNNIPRHIISGIFNKYFNYTNNFECIPKNKTIYVSNYVSDRLENIACIMIPNISIILADTFLRVSKLNNVICNLDSVNKYAKNKYQTVKKIVKDRHDNGYSVFVYIEDPSTVIGELGVGKLRSGMFSIAKELNITITPVVFDHIEYNKFGMIYKQNYSIKIGKSFHVKNVKNSIYRTRKFFRNNLKIFKINKNNNIYD